MKWPFLFFVLFSVPAFALDAEVSAVQNAIASKNADAIKQSLVALQLAANDFESSSGGSMTTVSQQSRNEIDQALTPIKSDLLDIASSNSPAAGAAINVLSYSNGGPQVYQTLKNLLSETQSSDLASKAYFALSQTGFADDSVQNIVAQRISTLDPQDNTGSSVALGLLHAAAYDPVPEALDTFIKILSTDNRTGIKIAVAHDLMAIGPSAVRALPELGRQLALLKADNADPRDIKTIEQAISVVSGTMTKSAPTKPVPASKNNATTQPPSSSNPPGSMFVTPPSQQPKPAHIVASTSTTSGWDSIVSLLITLCMLGLGLIVYRVFAKKKS